MVTQTLIVSLRRAGWLPSGLALAAGLAAAPALAQSAEPAAALAKAPSEQDIIVTGTRVKRDGYSAPTPETVLSGAEIVRNAPANIANFVNNLPQAAATATPRTATIAVSSGSAGSNFLNLRGLGASRTLVLLDGRRVVSASVDGLVDVNTLPSTLMSRVDVVTGGASAAYGSDAVAGVVNFVLDTKFTGLKGSIQSGITQYGDDFQWKADLAAGKSFADGRGHILVSGMYANSQGVLTSNSRPWMNGQKIIPNPAYTATNGQPQLINVANVNSSVATLGGLITSGVLKGTQFGQGGAYSPYTYGTVSGSYMIGGTHSDLGDFYALDTPVRQLNFFGRISFDVSNAFKVFGEVGYSDAVAVSAAPYATAYQGNLTLRADNAYLPAALASQLAAAGQSSFSYGTGIGDIGRLRGRNERAFQRYVLGAQGDLGHGWSYNVYGQYGKTNVSIDAAPNVILSRFALATDAVRNASGQIVCRVNQTTVTNAACVPFNPFGLGVNSAAAIAYVTGDSMARMTLQQSVVSGTIQGEPFRTWAGPVSLAAGGEYRKEQVSGTSDALSQANAYGSANYKPTNGHYDVKEFFLETVVPLARDLPFLKVLDVNGAFRRTDYSISGAVSTWKAGLSWEPVAGLRFRGTRSRDIRAPNLSDLFLGGVVSSAQTVIDRSTGTQTTGIISTQVGSQALRPERADTLTLGTVFQPKAIRGLSLSFDYYNIKVADSIVTLTNQQIVDLCAAGSTALCSAITRTNGTITAITRTPVNIAVERERGFDIEASYRHAMGEWIHGMNGNLSLRVLATHVITHTLNNGLATVEYAGVNSTSSTSNTPSWRVVSSIGYDQGAFSGQLTARSVSGGVYDPTYTAATLANNRIPGATYFDLALSVKIPNWGKRAEFFFNVDDLFNKDPVIIAPLQQQFLSAPINAAYYDTLGRTFRAGFRFQL